MAINFLSPLSIINCLELIFAVIISGLVGSISGEGQNSGDKVIQVAAYGYLIISAIVVICNIIKKEIPKNARLLIAFSGAIMFATSAGLLINYVTQNRNVPEMVSKQLEELEKLAGSFSKGYKRTLVAAGALSIIQVLLYMADGFFAFKSQSSTS